MGLGHQRRILAQRGQAFRQATPAEQVDRPAIDLADDASLVDHHHAVLHVLDDQLVDLGEVREVDASLRRQALARDCVTREGACQERSGEVADAEQPRLHELRGTVRCRQDTPRLLAEHRQRTHRRVEQHHPAAADQRSARLRRQQQQAEPARDAAACVHRQHDEQRVGQGVRGELGLEIGLAREDPQEGTGREHGIEAHRPEEQFRLAAPEQHLPVEQPYREHHHRHHVHPDGHGHLWRRHLHGEHVHAAARRPGELAARPRRHE